MLIDDACHCGNVSFTLEWLPAPTEIPARACGCSFCVKHGGVWTSNPKGSLQIEVKDQTLVCGERRPTSTAKARIRAWSAAHGTGSAECAHMSR
jgi:hypothetical protein